MVLRPSRTILHDALNGQTASGVRGLGWSCTVNYCAWAAGGLGHARNYSALHIETGTCLF